MPDDLANQLAAALEKMALFIKPEQQQQLCGYIKSLEKWNKAYNLTAIRQPSAMLSHHLLDSLAIVEFLRGQRFVDIGTGGGLPGIPLAIACPDREFTLVDSNGKKTRFLVQLVNDLGLKNVTVEQSRAEQLVDKRGFDMVLSRAFASLSDMILVTGHLLADGGHWLAMKGQLPEQELEQLPDNIVTSEIHKLAIPGLDAARHVLLLGRTLNDGNTP